MNDIEARVAALEDQVKAMVEFFKRLFPEAETMQLDPATGFERFRVRAEEYSRVLRGL